MSELSFEDLFRQITENPELMTKISKIAKENEGGGLEASLPKIIEAIKPEMNNTNAEISLNKSENTDKSTDKTINLDQSSLSSPINKIGEKINKNSKLLIALKPYLSKERCDIIESVVKLAQIADLMKLAR